MKQKKKIKCGTTMWWMWRWENAIICQCFKYLQGRFSNISDAISNKIQLRVIIPASADSLKYRIEINNIYPYWGESPFFFFNTHFFLLYPSQPFCSFFVLFSLFVMSPSRLNSNLFSLFRVNRVCTVSLHIRSYKKCFHEKEDKYLSFQCAYDHPYYII